MATATVAATDLRAELKEWERAFAAANGGRKADRLDIKSNPDIAAKYKAYGRLKGREIAADNKTTLEEHPKKRRHASPTGPGHEHGINDNNDNTETPRKSIRNVFATPSHPRTTNHHPSQLDPYDSPSTLRQLFSPSTHQTPLKTAVGPTPQRDGKALGLFDLLSESGGSTATPTAQRLASVRGAAVQTPSRRHRMETIMEDDEEGGREEEDTPRGGRTPASSGKKWYLANLFATPTTMRYAAMVEDEEGRERADANSQAARVAPAAAPAEYKGVNAGVMAGSETPSFLRRSNPGRSFNAQDPSANGLSPIAARKPGRFVGKGLSALVQGLRDMEEERNEDDLNVLREIEADKATMDNQDIQVEDNQELGQRPYKKKGQKRTTRRVRMKPVVVSKAQVNPSQASGENEDEDELTSAIPDTQLAQAAQQVPDHEDEENADDNDDDNASLHTVSEPDLDTDPDYDEPAPRSKSFSEKMQEAISANSKNQPQQPSQSVDKSKTKAKEKDKDKGKEKGGDTKLRARKVNPEAHANYRSLKIGRGRGRGAGRFGRR